MLMGTYTHSIDTKGRIIVPARIREDLGESFIITRNLDHCLALYPMEEWERFKEKLDTLPKVSSEPARRLRRFYFGNSEQISADKQGRILVSQILRDYAGLTRDVTLVGVDDHVEVWDSEQWAKYNEELDVNELMYDLDGLDL